MKLFNKVSRFDKHYYSLSGSDEFKRLIEASEYNIKTADAFLNADQHNDIRKLNDWLLLTEYTKKAGVELPFGSYVWGQENYPMPERLMPIIPRKHEKYINIASLDSLNEDIELFLNSGSLYEELGFMYRRGYLLHGPPGNGKTALIRELTKKYSESSYIIWCENVPSKDMLETLNQLPGLKIIIVEELVTKSDDSYFNMGRFLEFMDGEQSLKNCITIATTNYPEKLKANLANRPSRFDVVYEIKNPKKEQLYRILSSLLNRKEPITTEEVDLKDISFAQVKELVLLHKMYKISLSEAQDKIFTASEAFKGGFEEKKTFGFDVD